MKQLKDMTLFELREECRPMFELEERERKERIDIFLRSIGIEKMIK